MGKRSGINEPEFLVQEMILGYREGRKADSPEPSDNRTHSYRHGFKAGRNDLSPEPLLTADTMRKLAEDAYKLDTN
jgi:hypothetical protein